MIMAKSGIAMGKVRILTSVVLLPLRAANTDIKVKRIVKQTIPPKRIQTNAPISTTGKPKNRMNNNKVKKPKMTINRILYINFATKNSIGPIHKSFSCFDSLE